MEQKPSHLPHFEPDPVERSVFGLGRIFGDVVKDRLSRRDLMKQGLVASLAASAMGAVAKTASSVEGPTALGFTPIPGSPEDRIIVPEGYSYDVLVSYGDPILDGAPAYRAGHLDGSAAGQFGYNCDFVGYHPLPHGSKNSTHGLLSVNHEYVSPELMLESGTDFSNFTEDQVQGMKAAMGMSVVEVKQDSDGSWSTVQGGEFTIRYTGDSPFEITGPARGHDLMKTKEDPQGLVVRGTLANCAAGVTPWGTVLSGEENFQSYFGNGSAASGTPHEKSFDRYGIPKEASEYRWEAVDHRFDCGKDLNECYRFGWVVEIDPYDPTWVPKKRTALGRYRHEAATTHVSKSGHVVMYSGCDGRFEYIFKFVSRDRFNSRDRKANRDLMDHGVLYVAKFNEDGSGEWIELTHGKNGLTAENGFADQGEVVINARLAGDQVGATKMDRPEDIEVNPVNGKVYIVCTNNTDRGKDGKPGKDAMNPRDNNQSGHIIELTEGGDDHRSARFGWEMFMVCGDPKDPDTYFAGFDKSQVSSISCPDNIAFDNEGNLWIATDGGDKALPKNDGFYACPVAGPNRGKLQQFMSTVKGSEVCGPAFTPDGSTLFLAIQHPGEGGTFLEPESHWPGTSGAPRPSIIVVRAEDGRVIGSGRGSAEVDRRDVFGMLLGR